VVVEARLELGPVVGLDRLDPERQPGQDLVEEPDRGRLVAAVVGAQDADPVAVVDGRVLVVLLAGAGQRRDELDLDLDAGAGLRLLVPLPAVLVAAVPLRRGSRLMSRRCRMRQIPDGLSTRSWYRSRYIAILCGPKW
jgi:hypothetical protein